MLPARIAAATAILVLSFAAWMTGGHTPEGVSRLLRAGTTDGCCVSVPGSTIAGDTFAISVTPPSNDPLRVHVLKFGRIGATLSYAWAEFPGGGVVRTDVDPSSRGTYVGHDRAGLFWSAHTLHGDQSALWRRLQSGRSLPRRGYVVVVEQGNKLLGMRTVETKTWSDVGITFDRISEPYPGVLVRPAGQSTGPLVLLLGGSGDMVPTGIAVSLASKGMTVFAPRYVSTFGSSRCFDRVEISTFDKVAGWFQKFVERPSAPIKVVGISAGAEASLLIAAQRYKWLAGFVAIVPSQWIFNGATGPLCAFPSSPWSVNVKPVPYLLHFGLSPAGLIDGAAVRAGLKDQRAAIDAVVSALSADELAKYEVDTSTISVPGLLFGADDDEQIPSGDGVRAFCRNKLADQHFQCLTFPLATHNLSAVPGWRVSCADWEEADPSDIETQRCHGTMRAAQIVWTRTVEFLLQD